MWYLCSLKLQHILPLYPNEISARREKGTIVFISQVDIVKQKTVFKSYLAL